MGVGAPTMSDGAQMKTTRENRKCILRRLRDVGRLCANDDKCVGNLGPSVGVPRMQEILSRSKL